MLFSPEIIAYSYIARHMHNKKLKLIKCFMEVSFYLLSTWKSCCKELVDVNNEALAKNKVFVHMTQH